METTTNDIDIVITKPMLAEINKGMKEEMARVNALPACGRLTSVTGETDNARWLRQKREAVKLTTRPLCQIAREISFNWEKVNYGAKPYLDAMGDLNSIEDTYGCDSARSIVAYFLANASSWRGDVAKRVRAELKALLA